MRSAIYHRGLEGAALALLLRMVAAGTPAMAGEDPIAEAWVVVEGREDLARVEAVGLTVAEGHRALPDGRFEQRVLARAEALDALVSRGFPVRVERADHRRGAPRAGYRAPDVGDALLADLAATAPRAGLVGLGLSEEGRPILGLWLGQPPESGATTWRVLGAHHGDVWSSFEVALEVATALAEGDGTDAAITSLLDDATVWVVPYVNPDGVFAGSRYNANGVDLNRNYDVEWSAFSWGSGDGPFSESETRAIRTLASWSPPQASLSLHAGAENIGYVWNWTYEPTPEEPFLADLAGAYADAVDDPGFYATNGADWYLTRGDTNDWSYGRYGGLDFTVEISDDKAPGASDLAAYVAAHRTAVIAFLLHAPTLEGRVVDAVTGDPVEAFLVVERDGIDPIGITTHADGAFHRLAAPGPVTLEVWAPGYAPIRTDVTVAAPDVTIALDPVAFGAGLPSPREVTEATTVTLPQSGAWGFVRLVRPSHAERVLPLAEGRFAVDPASVAPGPWSVVLPDGTAWPRALLVEGGGPARLDAVEGDGPVRTLRGVGFAVGTRAWALVGPRRIWRSLPVLSESTDAIVLDTSGSPGNADLVAVSNGTWLVAASAGGGDDTGPTDTAGDTATDTDVPPPEVVRGTCSCATPGDLLATAPLALLALLYRRRTT